MTDPTPPLHPVQREQLETETTLVVTVESTEAFGTAVDEPPTLSFPSYDDLLETLTPRVLELIEAVRRESPGSINEAARVVDRDVKNVHGELTELARVGVIYFEEEGRSKRPVVWFDELLISLAFGPDAGDAASAAP